MKYEIKLVYKERILGPVQCKYRSVTTKDRYEYVLDEYYKRATEMIKQEKVYDAWVLSNLLDDNGEFIETII